MKTLNKFIYESSEDFNLLLESIQEIDENITLENVYESLFDKLYNNGMINEGLFSKIGNALAKLGDKAKSGGENLDKKIDQASDAAKSAINKAKEKAGEAWDKVKDVYTNAVTAIDSAIAASKETIVNLAEKFKLKKEELEATIANVYTNAMASGKEIGKKLLDWTTNASKFPAQLAAGAIIITGAKVALLAGFDGSMIMDLLLSAGVK